MFSILIYLQRYLIVRPESSFLKSLFLKNDNLGGYMRDLYSNGIHESLFRILLKGLNLKSVR
ncbi:hypothetical protein EZS27_031297 [termite gut metagenome]|uniref:Uncharacterized protein n=1 Tax=termite gut metagenome TaxID=433724 RepID=A0A5J4QCQ0_9ZZZZ